MTTNTASRSSPTTRGFTVPEVLAILLVLAILAAIAVFRHNRNLFPDAFADGETLKGALRYTRTRAMADIVSWSFTVAGQTGTVQRNGVTQDAQTVEFSTAGVAAGTTTFDNRGQPAGTLSYSVTNYPFSPVTVTTGTGFVP